MKRLLLDQGLPRSSVALLTAAGWDVLHVGDIGMGRADDHEILSYARTEGRVCVTLDADFHTLLVVGGEHAPSVIRIREEGLDAAAVAALLQTIWLSVEDALNGGAMVTVTERSIRVRRLPILKDSLTDTPQVEVKRRTLMESHIGALILSQPLASPNGSTG